MCIRDSPPAPLTQVLRRAGVDGEGAQLAAALVVGAFKAGAVAVGLLSLVKSE